MYLLLGKLKKMHVGNCLLMAKRSLRQSSVTLSSTTNEYNVIGEDQLRNYVIDCAVKVGCDKLHAVQLADNLIEADKSGHYSHGMNRLEMYIKDLESKICRPSGEPKILKESTATAWVDGRHLLGVVVGNYCVKVAIEKAKKTGIAWVTANNSNHFGIAAYYTKRIADKGLVGITLTNTSPLVFPTRGSQLSLGTNPLSVAAAGTKDYFVLDMATTTVALGKIELAKRKGTKIPLGWGGDSKGRETTDPEIVINEGGLLPLGGCEINGGYKGYALGLMVELFCGILAASSWGPFVRKWKLTSTPADLGQTFVALNPQFFAPDFANRVQEFMNTMRAVEPIDSSMPVLVPGDPERENWKFTEQLGGIPYGENQIKHIREIAQNLNVTPPDVRTIKM